MANNKTLLTAIERKRKQIARQRKKLKHAKSELDKDTARHEIARMETEMLNMQNQIKMNHAINSCKNMKIN
ncbi:coil containing protein [Vibrio phage 1.216.O._10N.222.55.C12]|nr:coil containing protein [Vibrio phage 1.216.O._10N.222.55.C12]